MENKILVLYKDYTENIYAEYGDNIQFTEVIAASHSRDKLVEVAKEKISELKKYWIEDFGAREDSIDIKEYEDNETVMTFNKTRYSFYIDSVDLV